MIHRLPRTYLYLGFLYVLGCIFCITQGAWILSILFLVNILLWFFLLQRDSKLIALLRLWLIPIAVIGLMTVYPLLPAVPGQLMSHWDSSWDLLLWGSLGLLTLMALVLILIARRQPTSNE
jgi:hypothetical protein